MMPTSIAAAHEQIVGLRAKIERLGQQVEKLETYRDRLLAEAHSCCEILLQLRDENKRLRGEITEWETVYYAANKMRNEQYDQLGEAMATNTRLRAVLRLLLEHYLDCYDGNRDQLAINAEALLGGEQLISERDQKEPK